MNGLMTRLKASDLFFSRLPFIDFITYENLDAPALTYPRVFDVRSSERAFEETTGFSGFDYFSEKQSDGGTIDYDSMLQLYDKRLVHLTYAKGFQITEEAQEDDIDGVINDAAPALGRAAQTSIETTVWNVINNGFSGGGELSPDGAALFASHNLAGGGTFSNLATGDFANSTMEAALTIYDTMVDERSLPVVMQPAQLIYPVQLRWQVDVVLNSQHRPGTANNDINSMNRVGLSQVMSRYITDTDSWYIGVAASQSPLKVYWRKEPRTDHVLDFETGNMKTKMTYRLSAGSFDWRGIVGSAGA